MPRVHALAVPRREVVPAAQVQGPVDDVEQHLAVEREPAHARLAGGGVRGHHDLAEEIVLLVLERKAHDVRRAGDAEPVLVDPRDRAVGDERNGQGAPGSPLGLEHRSRQRAHAPRVDAVAPLVVRDLDSRAAHSGSI